MLLKMKENMFFIGLFLMSVVLFLEHLVLGESNITCFFKGFACGLELVGIVILFQKSNKSSKK